MRMITTEEEALDAVKEGGHALWQVPGRLRTARVCLEATDTRLVGNGKK